MAYSSFSYFRSELARYEGFDMDEMDGYKKGGKHWSTVTSKLKPLFNHSDCDGELTVTEMEQMLPVLKTYVGKMKSLFFNSSIELLIESFELAIESDEPLEFQ